MQPFGSTFERVGQLHGRSRGSHLALASPVEGRPSIYASTVPQTRLAHALVEEE